MSAAGASLSEDPASWKGADILSIGQMNTSALGRLFRTADRMRAVVEEAGGCEILKHRVLANVFYEPSTRTSCSFAAAMLRLGGSVMQVDSTSSSVKKGETLSDTARCLECYSDAIVLRHPVVGSAAEAATATRIPVLNAGDGIGEHPTQALLDVYTILAELGRVDGLTVTLLGDLRHGRTVHSLARLLALYDVRFQFVAPESLTMPEEVTAAVTAAGRTVTLATSLSDALLAETDVLYVTRIQKERFASAEAYEAVRGGYVVDAATMAKAKLTTVVMHPLPRVDEIAVEVDADPRAAYFRQMRYGLYVRMALLALCCAGYDVEAA